MELAILKENLKQTAKAYYHDLILKSYPIHEQVNLTNGVVATGLDDMKTFISGKIIEENALIVAIDALVSTSVFDDFSTGSDESMRAFVAEKMPTLTTDSQKICIAIGIQSAGVLQ